MKLESNNFNLCLQVLYSSYLLLSVADSGLNMIRYFSRRQSWQRLVIGLKTRALARIPHETECGTPSLFSFQIYPLRVVLVSYLMFLKSVYFIFTNIDRLKLLFTEIL